MVECQLPKLDVAGSTPVSRSIQINQLPRIARSRLIRQYDTCVIEAAYPVFAWGV